jgi:hypothetical protein
MLLTSLPLPSPFLMFTSRMFLFCRTYCCHCSCLSLHGIHAVACVPNVAVVPAVAGFSTIATSLLFQAFIMLLQASFLLLLPFHTVGGILAVARVPAISGVFTVADVPAVGAPTLYTVGGVLSYCQIKHIRLSYCTMGLTIFSAIKIEQCGNIVLLVSVLYKFIECLYLRP